jgi:hypothetical protein
MSNKDNAGVFIADTPDAIEYANLAGIKYYLKIEKLGMTHRHGRLRPQLAKQLGLKPRDDYDKYIAKVQELMQGLLDKRAAEVQAEADAALAALPCAPQQH